MKISDKSRTDIIAAISSVPGPAYRAIIRISGNNLHGKIADLVPGMRTERGAYNSAFKSASINLPVTVLWMPAPNSFTGEDVAEIHFSGGETVQMMLLMAVFPKGIRLARPGEFTERAFLNGRIDLTRAEAVMTAINANSREEVQAAAKQLSGHLEKKLVNLRKGILNILAHVELALDFADQEIPPTDILTIKNNAEKLLSELDMVLCGCMTAGNKSRLTVAIFGAPGAGKSSFFNRMLGKEMSIVHPVPGTTRDVLEADWNPEGHEALYLRLADTPSLYQENEEISAAAMRSIKDIAGRADFIVWITSDEDMDIGDVPGLQENDSRIIRITRSEAEKLPAGEFAALLQSKLDVAPCGAKFVVNMRQRSLLESVRGALQSAAMLADSAGSEELIAEELRSAASGVNELTGGDISAEVLHEIFSSFCLGK